MNEQNKIKNLIEYFEQVRKRPGMYLGTNTITKLNDHLQGYKMAYWLNDIDNPIDNNFFDNFNEYVYSYYGVTTNDNWKGVILEQCFGNEQIALETFFEIFDQFINNTKVIDTKKIVIDFFDKLVLDQDELKDKLGNDFKSVLLETNELIKDNVLTNLKYDYNYIYEQLKERSLGIPQLKIILTELEEKYKT